MKKFDFYSTQGENYILGEGRDGDWENREVDGDATTIDKTKKRRLFEAGKKVSSGQGAPWPSGGEGGSSGESGGCVVLFIGLTAGGMAAIYGAIQTIATMLA